MSMTPFDSQQKDFSDAVHNAYRGTLYSYMFGVSKDSIVYDAPPKDFMESADGNIALDCTADVKFKGLRNAMRFTVSYRFRDAERYQEFQDVTFTEYNEASALPGELSKMAVEYFTYGYALVASKRLVEVIVIRVFDLKRAIAREQIPCTSGYNQRSRQPFVCYQFDDLKRANVVCLHLRETQGALTPVSVVAQ